MKRSNSYEAAFEAYLQWHRLCYVAVDETRRSFLGASRVKNLDFIVCGASGNLLLVDVKGRRYPTGRPGRQRRTWQSWALEDDIDGLLRWEKQFGAGAQGLLVFAYHLDESVELPGDTEDLWTWRGRRYLLRAIPVGDYCQYQRMRSPSWGTVYIPTATYRELARPFHYYAHECQSAVEEVPF
jgi:hypothetical protein